MDMPTSIARDLAVDSCITATADTSRTGSFGWQAHSKGCFSEDSTGLEIDHWAGYGRQHFLREISMEINELGVLRWLHIIAMVYWLGGEWGVFQTSYNVINRKLSIDERKRHLETAYRIDILARTGIILLLPLGLHMGNIWGIQPYGDGWLAAMWIAFVPWLLLCWGAFIYRETDRGIMLTKMDESIRYLVIPAVIISGASSLMGHGPFHAGPMQKWYSTKIVIYGCLLIIGLILRFVMREWTVMFRRLETDNGNEATIEAQLERSSTYTRKLAYLYWVGIMSVALLCTTKPF
jgi:hypothetical protein